MPKPNYFVVNTKSKTSLGKFASFSTAKAYMFANGLITREFAIWGFDPAELKGKTSSDLLDFKKNFYG